MNIIFTCMMFLQFLLLLYCFYKYWYV